MNTKKKPSCSEVAPCLKNNKFEFKSDNSGLDPTVPEIQMDHGNLQREESVSKIMTKALIVMIV